MAAERVDFDNFDFLQAIENSTKLFLEDGDLLRALQGFKDCLDKLANLKSSMKAKQKNKSAAEIDKEISEHLCIDIEKIKDSCERSIASIKKEISQSPSTPQDVSEIKMQSG